MKPPKVKTSTWQELFNAAHQFQTLSPWQVLDDSDMFGVKSPTTSEIGYCCVLGAARQVFGLCMYRGSEGLAIHLRLQSGKNAHDLDGTMTELSGMMAEFSFKGDLEKKDLAVLKAVGFEPDANLDSPPYPMFRSYSPGFAPWFLTEDEAQWMTLALHCAIDYLSLVKQSDPMLDPEGPDHIFTYLSHNTEPRKGTTLTRAWRLPEPIAKPAVPEIPLNELRIRKIENTGIPWTGAWEVDSFFLTASVIHDKERPYFPRVTMVADSDSGFICNMDVLSPEESAVIGIRESLLNAALEHGVLPIELHVRQGEIKKSIKPLTDRLGIKLKTKRTLPAIFAARESFENHTRLGPSA